MADSRYFHITLGPVQGFVAQARRTRDFWAGSFILSWLSAVAMKAVQKQGGEIQFPCPDKHYLDWLEGQGTGNAPVQGGVPNRFKATRAKVPTDFDADLIVQSIQLAWRSLAERVWQEDIAPVLKNNAPQQHNTRAVWERQINHFWEISWVITDDASATNLLDRRKNWRSHFPPDEPGVKCTMMDGWQELSAEARPHAGKLRTFWEPLQDQPRNRTIAYDLRDGEHLCALAFVKRRFVHYFHKLDVDMGSLDAALPWRLKGWTLPTGVPSVAHLAATHWIETVIDRAADQGQIECLDLFQKEARSLTGGYGEWRTQLRCIDTVLKKHHLPDKWGSWDGDVNFEFLLENEDRFPRRLNTRNTLKALRQLKKTLKVSSPSPFYAVLLMDGDSLGSQMSDETKQTGISEALNAFTLGVPEQVSAHNGFLVYAGGDDVLALLPLEDALDCALSLRHFYAGCFQQVNDERSIHIVTSLGLDNATAGVSPVAAESVSHLLYAEYLQSSGIKTVNEEDHAPQLASFKRLESLCRQYIRTLDEDRVSFSEKEQWRADAALLVRFLATKGADNER